MFFFHKYLYEEIDHGGDVIPIEFGCIAKLHSTISKFIYFKPSGQDIDSLDHCIPM